MSEKGYVCNRNKNDIGKVEYEVSRTRMEDTVDLPSFGIEVVINLGNFQSLRLKADRKGESAEAVKDEIYKDLLVLHKEFLRQSKEFLG